MSQPIYCHGHTAYRACKWCGGSGCLACGPELERATSMERRLRPAPPSPSSNGSGTAAPDQMPTKAIAFLQPWAWLVVHGHKSYENRTRRIAPPGTYYVHASASLTKTEWNACISTVRTAREGLIGAMPERHEYQLGGIVGWVTLGPWSDRKTADPWSWGSGYPILAAGPLPFTPGKGSLGVFEPDAIPVLTP